MTSLPAKRAGCSCDEIQSRDPLRHFRGCPLRKALPPGHPEEAKYEVTASALEALLAEWDKGVLIDSTYAVCAHELRELLGLKQ